MSFQKQKSLTSAFFTFIVLVFSTVSCDMKEERRSVQEIINGLQLEDGSSYIYSEESLIELGKEKYSLRKKAIYDLRGNLMKIEIYKPEGILSYTKEEILQDSILFELLGFPLKQSWYFQDNKLVKENNKTIKVFMLEENYLKTNENGSIILYRISQ